MAFKFRASPGRVCRNSLVCSHFGRFAVFCFRAIWNGEERDELLIVRSLFFFLLFSI